MQHFRRTRCGKLEQNVNTVWAYGCWRAVVTLRWTTIVVGRSYCLELRAIWPIPAAIARYDRCRLCTCLQYTRKFEFTLCATQLLLLRVNTT